MDEIIIPGWQNELAAFVLEADRKGKLIRCFYDNIVFTPKGLAECLIKGQFRWGLINWEMIDKTPGIRIDYPDPEKEVKCLSLMK
jgi:hypothetical protein